MQKRFVLKMRTKVLSLLVLVLCSVGPVVAQVLAPEMDERASLIIERIAIAEGIASDHFTSLKYYSVKDILGFMDKLSEEQRIKYKSELAFLEQEFLLWKPETELIPKKKWLGIYSQANALYQFKNKDAAFEIKPMLNIGLGKDQNDSDIYLMNQRGLIVNGSIDDKVYFHSTILESQARFTSNIRSIYQDTGILPGSGFVKRYYSNVFEFTDGVDYLLSRGHIGFRISKHIDAQFGHGRNFIGNGYRSLLLSDRTTNYLFAKINWRIGKVQLQNIFAELVTENQKPVSISPFPKKYMAAHYLGFKPFKNISLGLFEAVIFSRDDGFELNYLNPVIFYRTIEGMIGSPDNVIIGLDGQWNLPKRIQLYGQMIIDEFIFNELFKTGESSWTNKWGIQLGIKQIDFLGVRNLDVQYEYNTVRPYTYSHREFENTYGHYEQPLAHPFGANFGEQVLNIRYQFSKKWLLNIKGFQFYKGLDVDTESYGGDIFKPYTLRYADTGHSIGQGLRSDVQLISTDLSYELFHNLYIGAQFFWRNETFSDPSLDARKVSFIGGSLRYNINQFRNDL